MRFSRAAVALALLVLPAVSVRADERLVDQAEATIRWLITSSVEWERVTFRESKEQFLSFSEASVVGEGYASERSGWSGLRFRYSIKVHRKDLRMRDARVEFEDGRVLTGYTDWGAPRPPGTSRVRIDSPRRFEHVESRNVTFSGFSTDRKSVTVTVFDRRGRERGRRSVVPDRRGRWSTSMRLDPGAYRVEAASDRWSDGDEVRFSVENRESDWGFGGSGGSWGGSGGGWGGSGGSWGGSGGTSVSIERPRNGETLNDGFTSFTGRSDADEVNVIVYSGSRVVHRSTQKVFGSKWSAGPRLRSGSYRLVVENRNGRGRDEVRFSIRTGDFGGSGGSSSAYVSIDRPRNGESLGDGNVRFSGRSNADDVTITVYSGSRQVYRTTQRVRGGSWSASTRLGSGSYRLVVENRNGRGRGEVRFDIRSGGFGGSGGSGGFGGSGGSGGSGGFGGSGGSGGFGGSGGSGGSSNAFVSIDSPRSGQSVSGGSVAISGRSGAQGVNVTVYRGNSVVHRSTQRVSGGRWRDSVRLNTGSYRLVVEASGGGGRSESRFDVR